MKPDHAKIAAVADAALAAVIAVAMAAIAIVTTANVVPSHAGKRRIVGLRSELFIAEIDNRQMTKREQLNS